MITDASENSFLQQSQPEISPLHFGGQVMNLLQRAISFQATFSDTKNKMANNQILHNSSG